MHSHVIVVFALTRAGSTIFFFYTSSSAPGSSSAAAYITECGYKDATRIPHHDWLTSSTRRRTRKTRLAFLALQLCRMQGP